MVAGGPLTRCGLLKCTGWDARSPSPTSPCCTTCMVTMPHSEALLMKRCLRCHPTHSYHRMWSSGVEQLFNPPRDIPRGPHPCIHMPACPPHFLRSSAWNQRVRETPCSDVARRCDGALTARHPFHGGMFSFRRGPLCTARA